MNKKRPIALFLICVSVVILGGVVLLNDVVINIRIIELKGFLSQINREASKVDQIGMISKYKLHKELYENRISEEKRDEEELKTAYLITSFEKQTQVSVEKYKYISKPIVWIMNFFRFFLDKPPVNSTLSDPLSNDLTLAYYLERNKRYDEALKKYEEIIEKRRAETEQLPNILLHEGFCLSVIGENEKAKEKYITIIKDFNNEEASIVAAQLLHLLREFEDEVEKIKKSDEDMLAKSEKLYKLIAYKEALEVLKNIPIENEGDQMKIQYLKARCNEETGKMKESAKIYQDIINKDQNSEIAKLSNRRIVVISSVDENLGDLKHLAEQNNRLIRDESFDELLNTASKIESSLTPELLKQVLTPVVTAAPTGSPNDDPAATPQEELPTPEPEEDFQIFLEKSMELITEKIEEKESLMTPLPPTQEPPKGTPSTISFPRITPTARKTLSPTLAPTPKPSPTPVPRGSVFRRDSQGRIYRKDVYDDEGRGELLRYYIYEFAPTGKVLSSKGYYPDGTIIEE